MSKRELQKLLHLVRDDIAATGVVTRNLGKPLGLLGGIIGVIILVILIQQVQTQQEASELPPPFPACIPCLADVNKDGVVDVKDKTIAQYCLTKFPDGLCADLDLNADNVFSDIDIRCVRSQLSLSCPKHASQ